MQLEKFILENTEKFSQNQFSENNNPEIKHLIFGDIRRSYLNEQKLFMAYFGEIPNLMVEENIQCKKAVEWFIKNYGNEIKHMHFSKVELESSKNNVSEFDDVFFLLDQDLLVNFDTNQSKVRILFRKTIKIF